MKGLMGFFWIFFSTALCWADAQIPSADLPGSRDCSFVGRVDGSYIISFFQTDYDEAVYPVSVLKEVEDARDEKNNRVFKAKKNLSLEGEHKRIVYLNPEGISPFQALKTYTKALGKLGAVSRYACKNKDCGGAANRSSGGGGGE